MQKRLFLKSIALTVFSLAVMTGCTTTPPSNTENLCSIFQEKDSWYIDAHDVHRKYGVPINVAMSIMAQESGFREDAQPPMRWFLFIPYGRGSSAYGYAQAQDPVWDDYVDDEGSFFSSRSNFKDSLDFIGWYMTKTYQALGIPVWDVKNQYLAYHEGRNGFARGSHKEKPWLLGVATGMERRAEKYRQQLSSCGKA